MAGMSAMRQPWHKGPVTDRLQNDELLARATQTMADKDIGSLVVMEAGALVGMLTFREVMKAVHANRGSIGDDSVGQHMERTVLSISPDTDVNEIRRIMLERHARYVPVIDGAVLLGVMSFYDVARAVFEAQSFENKMLKAYIRDWPAEGEE